MSMSRADAVTFLAGIYAQQLTESGITATDDAANLGPVIDEALLTLGTSYDDLATAAVESADVPGYRVLLRYFGLSRIYEAVMHRVNISGGNPSASKSAGDYPKELRAALEILKVQAAQYGLVSGAGWQAVSSISFDFLEPDATSSSLLVIGS
jgi:hypothetical protein